MFTRHVDHCHANQEVKLFWKLRNYIFFLYRTYFNTVKDTWPKLVYKQTFKIILMCVFLLFYHIFPFFKKYKSCLIESMTQYNTVRALIISDFFLFAYWYIRYIRTIPEIHWSRFKTKYVRYSEVYFVINRGVYVSLPSV